MALPHLALYREFRPQRFADVVGQQHITRTLLNALTQNRLHHAYLLSGPRGTGKTSVARILAKAVNCLDPDQGEPCNACAACSSIISEETMDIIEIDAASNRGIDEIRDLRERVRYAPADLKRKVYIIDEVHMLTEPAFNALLKTLEEPPEHVMFVLATTERQKLPVTIVSRCQCFDYHRLSIQEIIDRLSGVCSVYGVTIMPEAATAIARQAEGGMRDALSLLEQVMAFSEDKQITLSDTLHVLGSAPLDEFISLNQSLLNSDIGSALILLDRLIRQGKDLRQFVRDYLTHLRDLLLLKVGHGEAVLDLPKASIEDMRVITVSLTQTALLETIKLWSQLESDMRFSASARLLVEVTVIRSAGWFANTPSPDLVSEPEPASVRPVRMHSAAKVVPEVTAPRSEPVQTEPNPVTPLQSLDPQSDSRLVQVWDRVLGLLSQKYRSTYALLDHVKPGPIRGQLAIVIVRNEMFVRLIGEHKKIIEKALEKVGLEGVMIQPVEANHPLAQFEQAVVTESTPHASDSGSSLLEMAKRVFPKDLVTEIKEE